jgi:hypothetical protein
MKGMGRTHVAPLAVVAAVAALVTPTAEAKFKVSLALEPAQPIARQPVRITMRTAIALPHRESVSLIAVGPWREQSGQGVLDVRLMRIGPRAFQTRVRFPYAGRWRLQIVSGSGATLTGRQVRVRSTAARAESRSRRGGLSPCPSR